MLQPSSRTMVEACCNLVPRTTGSSAGCGSLFKVCTKSLGPQPSSMSGLKPAPQGLIANCCFERSPLCLFLARDSQGRCMRTCAQLPFIRPCAAKNIIQGSLACSPRLRRPDKMLLHSCMCRTEATRIVAHMCHGALRPFHTLVLVEERLRCSRFWLRVLDLRRHLDLGRDERPATFMATDALWMPVHRKALWLRWYITASDKLLSLF